jgi:hypothetical protein
MDWVSCIIAPPFFAVGTTVTSPATTPASTSSLNQSGPVSEPPARASRHHANAAIAPWTRTIHMGQLGGLFMLLQRLLVDPGVLGDRMRRLLSRQHRWIDGRARHGQRRERVNPYQSFPGQKGQQYGGSSHDHEDDWEMVDQEMYVWPIHFGTPLTFIPY